MDEIRKECRWEGVWVSQPLIEKGRVLRRERVKAGSLGRDYNFWIIHSHIKTIVFSTTSPTPYREQHIENLVLVDTSICLDQIWDILERIQLILVWGRGEVTDLCDVDARASEVID